MEGTASRLGARIGVRARLTLIAAAASIATLAVGGWLFYRSVTSTLDAALTEELRAHALDVRDEVSRGVSPSLNSGIETQVLDPTGATVQPAGEAPLLNPSEVSRASRRELAVDVDRRGRELRIVAVPAPSDLGTKVVVSAASTASIAEAERRLVARLVAAAVLMAGASAVAAWVLSGAALRPVRRMSRRATTISTEDPQARLPVPPGSDEVAELGATLNQMLARIADARARERAFVDDASHELRAPLAVMRGELELAKLERADVTGTDDVTRALDSALEEADRLARLTDHLLVLARADAGMLDRHQETFPLVALVRHCARRLPAGEVVVTGGGLDLAVSGDRLAIEQVVNNVLVNAQHWAVARVAWEVEALKDQVVLRVADDGPGFPADYLAHAFDRFRRGDPSRPRARSGASTGLGLAIAASVVAAHGGQIRLGNGSVLGGAWVEVLLPTEGRQARIRVPSGS